MFVFIGVQKNELLNRVFGKQLTNKFTLFYNQWYTRFSVLVSVVVAFVFLKCFDKSSKTSFTESWVGNLDKTSDKIRK